VRPLTKPLPRDFYARPTIEVARDLLGCHLCHRLPDGELLVARITETEAYDGPSDSACHGAKGRTARTDVLFGPPGHAYIYLIYGMYELFNVVTDRDNYPAGVLIRGIEPVLGEARMCQLRPVPRRNLCNGPGKLTRAMNIDRRYHGLDLTTGDTLWLSEGASDENYRIESGPRIGIDYADEIHRLAPWRFWLAPPPN